MVGAVRVDGLVKSYGENAVLKGVSFGVEQGEIFGLLGANGAGKTTTLECIEGLRSYEAGTIRVDGSMGVQLQSASLPDHIRASEALMLFARWNKAQIDVGAVRQLGVDTFERKQYRELSTGQKRRLHLAIALVGDPDVVVLDEPTAGLDVEGRAALHQFVGDLRRRGKVIIMSSHDMAEVEDLCDRIAILKDGDILYSGSTGNFRDGSDKGYRIRMKTDRSIDAGWLVASTKAAPEKGYEVFETSDLGEGLYELVSACRDRKITIADLEVEHESLGQRFIDLLKEG